MFLSTPVKILNATIVLSLFFAGCGLWRRDENRANSFVLPRKNELPFSSREPETFQADLVIRTAETERRIRIARSGQKRRIDYDPATDNHRVVIITDKEYVVSVKKKTYTERALSSGSGSTETDLASTLLNVRDYTEFDEIGRDGKVVQFRATINESVLSEVLISFDEAIGLPVKEEFFSVEGAERKLRYSVEVQSFTTEFAPAVFEIPAGFRRLDR